LDQLSVRALAERHEVHRRTVRQALDSALPPPRKAYPRPAPAIGPWTEVIDSWLVGKADERVPRKQRHTARRAWHSSHGKTSRDNSSPASVMRKDFTATQALALDTWLPRAPPPLVTPLGHEGRSLRDDAPPLQRAWSALVFGHR
jgi:hypothetical protein